jgi:hypothetical protein
MWLHPWLVKQYKWTVKTKAIKIVMHLLCFFECWRHAWYYWGEKNCQQGLQGVYFSSPNWPKHHTTALVPKKSPNMATGTILRHPFNKQRQRFDFCFVVFTMLITKKADEIKKNWQNMSNFQSFFTGKSLKWLISTILRSNHRNLRTAPLRGQDWLQRSQNKSRKPAKMWLRWLREATSSASTKFRDRKSVV